MAARDGKINRPSAAFEVAEYIREQIFGGELAFGSKIPQDAIAASLGVSRLPVREALIALESDGMVVTVPHRGTFVADISPDDLLDHYNICGVIHGLAAKRAAEIIRKDQLTDLARITDRMGSEPDDAKAYEFHFQFHQTINRIGGSRRLRAVLHQLSHQLPQSLFTSVSPSDIDAENQHKAIIDALRVRDGAAASELCRVHLHREGQLTVTRLEDRGLWAPRPAAASAQ